MVIKTSRSKTCKLMKKVPLKCHNRVFPHAHISPGTMGQEGSLDIGKN